MRDDLAIRWLDPQAGVTFIYHICLITPHESYGTLLVWFLLWIVPLAPHGFGIHKEINFIYPCQNCPWYIWEIENHFGTQWLIFITNICLVKGNWLHAYSTKHSEKKKRKEKIMEASHNKKGLWKRAHKFWKWKQKDSL